MIEEGCVAHALFVENQKGRRQSDYFTVLLGENHRVEKTRTEVYVPRSLPWENDGLRDNYQRHSVMSNKNSEFLKLLIVSQSRKPGKAVGCDEVAQDRGDAAKA